MSALLTVSIVASSAAVIEAAALIVVLRRLRRARREIAERLSRGGGNAADPIGILFNTGRGAVKTVWQTANLVRTEGFGAAVRSSIEDLADWAEVERPDLARIAPDGRVVLMFTDIEESTALNERIGDRAWVRLIAAHDALVGELVAKRGGHVVKSQGDGFMIAFGDPAQAVRCAVEIQRALRKKRQRRTAVSVRIGIHQGRSVRRGDDLFGRNVAMAARVAAAADGGQILISRTVRNAVADCADLRVDNGAEFELKGFTGTHRLYEVDSA